MKINIAKLFSFLFHPVILALLLPLIVTYHRTNSILHSVGWMLLSMVFIFLTLFIFFLARPVEFLTDFDISKREQRPIFYTISLCVAIVYFLLIDSIKGFFFPLTIVVLGTIISIAVFAFANRFLKVSIHGAVAFAFVITIGAYYGWNIFLFICWLPFFVVWSRVILHKHTVSEITVGSLLGIAITLITFAIGRVLV